MSAEELAQAVARVARTLPIQPILIKSWQRSQSAGISPDHPPVFRRVSEEELQRRQASSRVLLEVAVPHLRWLSQWFHQRPHVAYIVDRDGIVLHAEGDPESIARYRLSAGYDWSEAVMGTNGAGTALAAGVPVAVVGCDHWAEAWKDATCLGAPILGCDGSTAGAIDISMDVQNGDADRLIVVAHVAYTIAQELARRDAEAANQLKDNLYEVAQEALAAAERARAEAEAALALHRQAEADLRASEQRLRLAIAATHDAIYEIDFQSGELRFDDDFCTVLGHPREVLPTTFDEALRFWSTHLHPDDRGTAVAPYASALEDASAVHWSAEYRLARADGSYEWIAARAVIEREADGTPIRTVGALQDITGRKEAERALHASERGLQTIIDSMPAVVYAVDAEHRFRLMNREFGRLFGIDTAAAVGRSLYDFFPQETADQLAANNREVLDSGAPLEFEEAVPHADGLHTYVSVKAPLLDELGAPFGICGVSVDVTQHKRLTLALEEAQRQKDAFVATVAHELRQPLGAIHAALGVMRVARNPDMAERARLTIERQTGHLGRLVEDLLDASRISQGNVRLERHRVTLNSILEAALSVVKPDIERRRQQLEHATSAETIWLDADPGRLQQVFSNLLTNASKFTPADGRVMVCVEKQGQSAVVTVRDTGRGIPADALPRIFDMFAQAESDGRGLGIGLTVVRGLTERHGGSVEARSAGPGQGSEFIVRLPIAAPGS